MWFSNSLISAVAKVLDSLQGSLEQRRGNA
jgi:hypothetical protein